MHPSSAVEPSRILRRLTWPVAFAVGVAVAAAWYVTWASSDLTMGILMSAPVGTYGALPWAFLLLVVMMVAMMLPSALPMVLTYHDLTRLEAGEPTKPADVLGTAVFASSYFVVWGLFSLAALLGLALLGLTGSPTGAVALAPTAVLLAAGAWQVTRTKEACLSHCQSPVGFVMRRWRGGRRGAWRMGVEHASYCVGCCWLFMLVLFVTGAMSLLWMGAISVAIFVEKIGWRPLFVPRGIGVLLITAGVLLAVQAAAFA